jgi:DNA polymerase IIIc chi subunit
MCDDEDDVVVMRVCHARGCMSMMDLTFDEQVGEYFCAACTALFARALKEGYAVLLSEEDKAVVSVIFDAFDRGRKRFWTFAEYQQFVDNATSNRKERSHEPITSADELREYFKEEYDIDLQQQGGREVGVTLQNLLEMYGGYQYNGIEALRDDTENLEQEGAINLSGLE